MKISYKRLQSYFEEKLPEPAKLAELLTFSFSEVEGMEKVGEDTVFDIKVLPDRACYALSHRGVAYEVAAITGFAKKEIDRPQPEIKKVRPLLVRVEAPDLCPRYMARLVWNVTQKEFPWVKEHLEAVGQRSINPVVDGANLVMFDMGQPLHAFDADKVKGAITVRRARKGEKLTALDNREVVLDESVLVIADDEAPLALAGIKGGKKAEVTATTKNLILEAASFDASYIRKTSERLGIKTDASKRFENRFSPELAGKGIDDFTAYLFEMDKNLSAGEMVDERHSYILQNVGMSVTAEYVSRKLGLPVSEAAMLDIFKRLEIAVEKKGKEFILTPPVFRADLSTPEDVVEEIGRIVGYDKIPAELPPKQLGETSVPKSFYYEWKIREFLVGAGFSEVMTTSFSEQGSVAILKPLAADKSFARPDLRGSFAEALKMNSLNAPLFGTDETRIFEIGHVFSGNGEYAALALGFVGPKKKTTTLAEVVKMLGEKLGVTFSGETRNGVFECNLDSVFTKLPELQKLDVTIPSAKAAKFQTFSPYPFIVRDISMWISDTDEARGELIMSIFPTLSEGLLQHVILFDQYKKDGKNSLAFRLVFQSFEKTLTDGEVNSIMEKIYAAIKGKGWEVR